MYMGQYNIFPVRPKLLPEKVWLTPQNDAAFILPQCQQLDLEVTPKERKQ